MRETLEGWEEVEVTILQLEVQTQKLTRGSTLIGGSMVLKINVGEDEVFIDKDDDEVEGRSIS